MTEENVRAPQQAPSLQVVNPTAPIIYSPAKSIYAKDINESTHTNEASMENKINATKNEIAPSSSSSSSSPHHHLNGDNHHLSPIDTKFNNSNNLLSKSENQAKGSDSSDEEESNKKGMIENYQEVIANLLGSNPAEGLSEEEVKERVLKYGKNEITEKKVHPIIKFLTYFVGPMPFLIEAAAILSGALQEFVDMGIIIALLVINAIIGFSEEHSAASAVAALKASIPMNARVWRSSRWHSVPVADVVPGDRVHLKLGDCVCADGVVIKLSGDSVFAVDQAALTGESRPVKRRIGGQMLSGGLIKEGEGEMIVMKTGIETFMGKAANLVMSAPPSGHFKRILTRIGQICVALDVIAIIIIVSYASTHGYSGGDIAQFILVLTIASIPIALPTVLSVTMAVGANALRKHDAVTARLTAVEELSSLDCICCDKTGTLTKNKLTADTPVPFSPYTILDVNLYGALACNWHVDDAIDSCILAALGSDKTKILEEWTQHSLQPFDPVTKRMSAVVTHAPSNRTIQVAKGAPRAIFRLLQASDAEGGIGQEFNSIVNSFASRGLRSLAVAKQENGGQWELVGMIPLFDPPRDDSAHTINELNALGVHVKMITGDDTMIGMDTAQRLGMGSSFVHAHVMRELAKSQDIADKQHLTQMIEEMDGMGESFPEDKYTVVKVLQAANHCVGMTGDGANDAPALALANVGIAVSGSTDAARSAADLVLLSPGLSVIAEAVKAARCIFARMNGYATYRFVATFQILCTMTLLITCFNTFLKPIQIIFMAIANDFVVIFIAFDNAIPEPKPVLWNMTRIFTKGFIMGLVQTASSIIMVEYSLNVINLDIDTVLTMLYLHLSVEGSSAVFSVRTRNSILTSYPSARFAAAIFGGQIFATFASVYGAAMTAIGWKWAGIIWLYSFASILIFDFIKQIYDKVEEYTMSFAKPTRRQLSLGRPDQPPSPAPIKSPSASPESPHPTDLHKRENEKHASGELEMAPLPSTVSSTRHSKTMPLESIQEDDHDKEPRAVHFHFSESTHH